MAESTRKRYSIKVGHEERVFLEREMNRLMQLRFARTRRFERVTFAETLGEVVNELRRYRETCTCRGCEEGREDAELEGERGRDAPG